MTQPEGVTPMPADDHTLPWVPPEGAAPPPVKGWRGRVKRAGKWVLIALAAYYVFCLVLLVVYRFASPPVTGLQLQRRVEAMLSGAEYEPRKRFVSLAELPRHVPRAVIAAEDGRFREHWGFDWGQMWVAQREAFGGNRIRGASTLTQQLAKNLFGCACRNPIRKAYDLLLTPPAELILGKDRIMELYLNEVEWGSGIYGIEEAARHHYGVAAEDLSRTQAAGLAALLPNPRVRSPESTSAYRREILRRMSFRGW